MLCGLAGGQLALSLVTQWVEGMTAGRGFVALVAMMSRGRTHRGRAGAALFGFAYALAVRLQGVGIPPQFVSMLPYVVTILALVVFARRGRVRTA